LLACYDLDPNKVHVIPEAAAPHFRPQSPGVVEAVRRRHKLPGRYVVSVGTLEPRKNLIRLVDACGPLIREGLLDGLILVGAKGWLYESFFHHLEALPWRERVVLPGFVAEEDLPAIYAGALAAVQPSLYEGFGLPVLEAMACGTPVCASSASSLPEVGSEAALYFDPQNTAEMTGVLRLLLKDLDLRVELRRQGLARAAMFSWQRTAVETLAVYQCLE
jgi:glycosyltransferase involved in cell wall biosynthesis